MDTPIDAPQELKEKKKGADPLDMDKMQQVIEQLRAAMTTSSEEDIDQVALVKMVQKNRAFLLEYAMAAYLDNPKNGELLGSVTSIIAAIEKCVREDRKERFKAKENENNQLAFTQVMEALDKIGSGAIRMPVFDFKDFILDPTKTLVGGADINPINDEELVQGNQVVDIDGQPV